MYEITRNVLAEVKKAIVGKDDVISKVWIALLAEGHVLLEDIPGVGKDAEVVHSLAKWKRMALKRYDFQPGEGLVKDNVEDTIRSVGRMGRDGMKETDIEILNIMLGK